MNVALVPEKASQTQGVLGFGFDMEAAFMKLGFATSAVPCRA